MEWMDKYSERERKNFIAFYIYSRQKSKSDGKFVCVSEVWIKDDEGTAVNIQCNPSEGLMYVDGIELHVPSYLEKLEERIDGLECDIRCMEKKKGRA